MQSLQAVYTDRNGPLTPFALVPVGPEHPSTSKYMEWLSGNVWVTTDPRRETTVTEDDNSGFDLSRRKVLGGVLTVGAASAATGAGTMAYFSDTEESNDNTVSAGTLDLAAGDGSRGPYTIVNVPNAAPGYSDTKTQTLENGGTIDGTLSIRVDQVTESGGDNPEPEQDAEGDGNNDADLADFLDVAIAFDGTQKWSGKASQLSSGQSIGLGSLPGDEGNTQKDVDITVSIPNNADNVSGYSDINVIQGDSVTVDATFTLEQSN